MELDAAHKRYGLNQAPQTPAAGDKDDRRKRPATNNSGSIWTTKRPKKTGTGKGDDREEPVSAGHADNSSEIQPSASGTRKIPKQARSSLTVSIAE